MMIRTIEQFDYCMNICPHQNRYDGWCNYYYKDLAEIDISQCEVIKKKKIK